MEVNQLYNKIIEPDNFVQYFKTEKDFINFVKDGTIVEQLDMLEIYEQNELYEYCAIIKDVINGLK